MSHVYRSLCRDQEQSFKKKTDWDRFISPPAVVVFGVLYTENYHSRKPDATKYRLLCTLPFKCVFRSNVFASACYLVNISTKNNRCQSILFHETMRCDFIISLVPNKKCLKKLKILMCLERTSQLKWNRKYIKPMLQKCSFLEVLAINCDIKY